MLKIQEFEKKNHTIIIIPIYLPVSILNHKIQPGETMAGMQITKTLSYSILLHKIQLKHVRSANFTSNKYMNIIKFN